MNLKTTHIRRASRRVLTGSAASAVALVLTACGAEEADGEAAPDGAGAASGDTPGEEAPADDVRVEVDEPETRLVVATDSGAIVLDAATGSVLGTFETQSRPMLSVAGDGRHAFLAQNDSDLTQVLDAGSWASEHGDHAHYYVTDPVLRELRIEGADPAHVVSHAGHTAVFHDGEGTATVFRDAGLRIDSLDTAVIDSGAPHHGVVVPEEGFAVVSIPPPPDADDTLPVGVTVVDEAGAELARFEDCPELHGETAADHVLAFACADGVLLVEGEDATKLEYPAADGRIGSFTPGPATDHIVGDFTDTSLLAVDIGAATAHEITLDQPYAARALDEHGDLVVLTVDGTLHVIDPADGDVKAAAPGVLPAFEIPEDWQEPRPTLTVAGHTAYVADPASSSLLPVDLESLTVGDGFALDAVPAGIVATGMADHVDH